ncbi:hypothetical protein PQ465_13445 [Sphingobacterium oryzagri]|uniref:Uncharacterized protein n=1 Tax=Sphingobacterium oryzagri TaxID=3025669 RepID=A0ABY7WCD0_9SPHI|nr:hypothetical protein [Sphingobacterium sp. KACC 22765]WDF67309.1 hypothetical protein PQ465_13445 [Sphingobacterium sp. KACC 22765]
MIRRQLNKFGQPILTTKDDAGLRQSCYTLVAVEGKAVGVAVYHANNAYCTAAILEDEQLGDTLIMRFDEAHPYEEAELIELQRIFNWAFK